MACMVSKNDSDIKQKSRGLKINSFQGKSQAQIMAKSFSQIKSSSWRVGHFKSIENHHPKEIVESRVLALNEDKMKDPERFLELVAYFGSKKNSDFYKNLKIEQNHSRLKNMIKDKPTYQQASATYKCMYCVCKVCGLKDCKCNEGNEILPFSSLSNRADNNESISINNDCQPALIKPQYKISTIRALTAEPVHRKHAKLVKNGKPICRFSDLKDNPISANTPSKEIYSSQSKNREIAKGSLRCYQNNRSNLAMTAPCSSKRLRILSKNRCKV